MLPKTPAPDTFPIDSGKARDGGSGSSEPHQQVQYLNYKKGSTEVMVPNLLKKNSSILHKTSLSIPTEPHF